MRASPATTAVSSLAEAVQLLMGSGEVFSNAPLPPDFNTFWKQARIFACSVALNWNRTRPVTVPVGVDLGIAVFSALCLMQIAFGVLNQQSPALTAQRWNPILHYVSAMCGVPLQLRMGRTVQETDAMMGRGDFDFAFTNHNFQSEFDAVGFKVVARWAGEPIRAVIAVPADSPIHHLHELGGDAMHRPDERARPTADHAHPQATHPHLHNLYL